MRDWDIQIIFHFIRRPGMYTGSFKANDYKRIDSFLIAYEMGSMNECKFRDKLIEQIQGKYNVEFPATGLLGQLRRASKAANQGIHEFFISESMEILIKESDQDNKNKFVNYKRKELINRLEQFPSEIDYNWVFNFANVFNELKAWKGVNLINEENILAQSLIDGINQLLKDRFLELVKVPKQLKSIKEILLTLLKENVR
ncbi:MAG: hypothetical protein IPM86_09200 [Saprospiraceae bacterium]|nr:hypothetical protein [Saprospiraceae bacterium]